MIKDFFKGVILVGLIILFITIYKILFFDIIENYFSNIYSGADYAFYTVICLREIPYLIALAISIILRKFITIKWRTLIVGFIFSYIIVRFLW